MALLEVSGLCAGYGQVQVLRDVDFTVDDGEMVVLLGANGAGKTTTLRALCQMIDTWGSVRFAGEELVGKRTERVVRRGIGHVPQGRGTFPELTVEENLEAGAYTRKDRAGVREDIDRWFSMFPRLQERRTQQAGSLSGGEQQMLAVARALMTQPRLLMCDEPSLGLAPTITQELFALLARISRERRMALLLVEQNARLTLKIAHRAYVIESGEIRLEGAAAELRDNPMIQRAYLGT